MDDIEHKSERILANLDRAGLPPLTVSEWLELLQKVQSGVRTRIDAAKDDLRRTAK